MLEILRYIHKTLNFTLFFSYIFFSFPSNIIRCPLMCSHYEHKLRIIRDTNRALGVVSIL